MWWLELTVSPCIQALDEIDIDAFIGTWVGKIANKQKLQTKQVKNYGSH